MRTIPNSTMVMPTHLGRPGTISEASVLSHHPDILWVEVWELLWNSQVHWWVYPLPLVILRFGEPNMAKGWG